MKTNKKGYNVKLFGFFFALIFVSALMMFLSLGMHFILNNFGIEQIRETGKDLIGNDLNENSIALDTYADEHLNFYTYYDYIFLVLIISLFIESIYSAIKTQAVGWYSFFGFATIGNIFLLFMLGYATQIQGWILNEFVYNFIIIEINTPIMTSFIEYSPIIVTVWYLILLGINMIDLGMVKDKMNALVSKSEDEKVIFEQ